MSVATRCSLPLPAMSAARFFGGLLLLLSTRDEWASAIFFGLAVFFGLVTLVFVRNGFGLVFGCGTALSFALLSRRPFPGTHYIVDILAVTSSLYAVYDPDGFLVCRCPHRRGHFGGTDRSAGFYLGRAVECAFGGHRLGSRKACGAPYSPDCRRRDARV